MAAIILLAAVPLIVLNMLGGLVGGVGLAIEGEWSVLVFGIVWCLIGVFVLSIILMPGMIFDFIAVWAAKRGSTAAAILACVPSLVWTYAVVIITSVFVFCNVVARPDAGLFHLLWGYSITTAPWSFLAKKDRQAGNETSTMLMFFVQLGVVAMMFASWANPSSMTVRDFLPWFVPFMLIGGAIQLFVAVVTGRNSSNHAR